MENLSRKKIAYYTINDPMDKRSWSGTTYYLGKSLQKNIGDVDFLGPVKIPWLLDKTLRGLQKLSRFFFKVEYIPKYSLLKNVYAARCLKRKMKKHQYDFLVAPGAAPELAYLNTCLPVIYYGDATYKIYSEDYEKEFKNLSLISRWEGNHLEKRALKKSALLIFASQWAATSAINDYQVPPEKVEIILLGANMDIFPEPEIIFKKEENAQLTLLFLGVDWERKGGAIAFDALIHLHSQGIKARLIVCGVIPPPHFVHQYMEVIPFLNKNEPQDYRRFVDILSTVHFLIIPTRADCSLLVNAEANAYGVPTISTKVGGVAEVVKDGINGYCLPFDATGADYALSIKNIFLDKEKYHSLIASSRREFEEKLNWEQFAVFFSEVLKKHQLTI